METKGPEEIDLPRKMARLGHWCLRYGFVYVDQRGFEKHRPESFGRLVIRSAQYQENR